MNASASIQIDQTLRTIIIPSAPLKPAATEALRTFWTSLGADERALLNRNVAAIVAATHAPAHIHGQIALRVLWGALDLLNLDARWDAFAASVRWPAIA